MERSVPSTEEVSGPRPMIRVLVTGASGLIGRTTIPLLIERDYEVHAVTSGASHLPGHGVEWHTANLLDAEATTNLVKSVRPQRLLHLAWYAAPREWRTSLQNVRWTEASLHLMRAFAEEGGTRAVVSGSCAEYDPFFGFFSEGVTPLRPTSLYGACKHATQLILAEASSELQVRLAWARIFFVYGPGEHPERLVASVIRSVLRGEPATCAHGGHIRDYLSSYDVGSALVRLLDSDLDGPVNVASGRPVFLRDIVATIGELTDRPDLIVENPFDTAPNEPAVIVGDIRRLTEVAGWTPALPLREGLERTIEWWRGRP